MPALGVGAHTEKVEELSGARVHRFSLTPTCRPIVTIRADTFWRTYAARWRHLALRFPHRSRPDGAERWSARTVWPAREWALSSGRCSIAAAGSTWRSTWSLSATGDCGWR